MNGDDRLAEAELVARYHEDGDNAAREELVERYLPFARDLALRYAYMDEPFDDLLQVASLGLLKAIDRFEPGRGTKFTSYAAPTILGELKRHFRDKSWALHVPRLLQERTLAMSRETEALTKSLGRSPSVREVAMALGCSTEQVLETQEVAMSYDTTSLDAPTGRDNEDGGALVDLLGEEDSGYELAESRDAIAASWKTLPRSERERAGAALHARSHSARDRRADRLLADARVAIAQTRPPAARDGLSRRLTPTGCRAPGARAGTARRSGRAPGGRRRERRRPYGR